MTFGSNTNPEDFENGLDPHTWIALIWSIGSVVIAWLAYQAFRWWNIHRQSTTYQTLLGNEQSEVSTLRQPAILGDSFRAYMKETGTISKMMSLLSLLYLIYLSLATIHIMHMSYNHPNGFAGLTELEFNRGIMKGTETAVGAGDYSSVKELYEMTLGSTQNPAVSIEEFEVMLAEEAQKNKVLDQHMVVVTSTITAHYAPDECSTLPSDDPGNENRKWKMGCNSDGQAWYTYYNDSMCTGTPFVERQTVADNIMMFGEFVDDEFVDDEASHHISQLAGNITLKCDQLDSQTGEYLNVIAVEEIYPKRIPCDKYHLLEHVAPQMQQACDKYDSPDATFSSVWECAQCIGNSDTPAERTGASWEVMDMKKCDMATTYTQQFINTMQGHVLRDGGDAICLSFLQADDPPPIARRRLTTMTKDGLAPHAAEPLMKKSSSKMDDNFHNHPQRNNMVKHIESQLGVTYNEQTREFEVAEGHTEESVRAKLKDVGAPVQERESEIRRQERNNEKMEEVKVGASDPRGSCRFEPLMEQECPCTWGNQSGCDLKECHTGMRNGELCEADQNPPGYSGNWNHDNCPGIYDVFRYTCDASNMDNKWSAGGQDDYYGSQGGCDRNNLSSRMNPWGDMNKALTKARDAIFDIFKAIACFFIDIGDQICKKTCFLGWCKKVCSWIKRGQKKVCEGNRMGDLKKKLNKFVELLSPFFNNELGCGSPNNKNSPTSASKDKARFMTERRNLGWEENFARDVLKIETSVGESNACRDLSSKSSDGDTGCPGLLFYPAWEGGVAMTLFFMNFSYSMGYAGSQDGVVFSYMGFLQGNEIEIAAMDVFAMMNLYTKRFSDFLGRGEEFCAGVTVPGLEIGVSMCFGWPIGGDCCNSFHMGVSAGVGFSPIEIAWGEPEVFCIDAGCI